MESSERQKAVQAALEQLSPDFRDPIVLCDMEGLPYEVIAERLACPIGTVRSRIHRGRRRLQKILLHVAPIAAAAATALGAWFLHRAQKQFSSQAHIEMVGKKQEPPIVHAKGESRENEKS
jgi:hypothetical protein